MQAIPEFKFTLERCVHSSHITQTRKGTGENNPKDRSDIVKSLQSVIYAYISSPITVLVVIQVDPFPAESLLSA